MPTAYLFDEPRWVFKTPTDDTQHGILARTKVEVRPAGRAPKAVELVLPSGVPRFVRQVFGVAVEDFPEVLFSLTEEKAHWVLRLCLDHEYVLWYYTTSTLPYWAKTR